MKLEGSSTIEAAQDKVWEFLTTPDLVGQCVPGLQSMEVIVPDEHFKAIAAIGFGTAMVTFSVDVYWKQLEPPNFAVMTAHGDTPGSAADVSAEMHLTTNEAGTTDLAWEADVQVVGTIAALASRMMGSVTKVLTRQFFGCVNNKINV